MRNRRRRTLASGESGTPSPMKKTIQTNRVRKDPATLVDELIQRRNSIRECEEKQRDLRREMIKAGRLELARQSLRTPMELEDLAGFLWYGRPMVVMEETMIPSRPLKRSIRFPVKPQSINRKFPKKFVMTQCDGESRPLTKSRAVAITNQWHAVKAMIAKKVRSDLFDRLKVAARGGGEIIDQPKMIRELAIETARWRYPLEEWATIFPDAALAGDYDFIKRIVDQWTEPAPLDLQYWAIAFFWNGFESVGLASRVPPLKYWRDKAACEFVSWKCRGDSISIDAYKACKKKLGLRSGKPKLVTFAEYTRQRKDYRLYCER
jgi:hypothetical protein